VIVHVPSYSSHYRAWAVGTGKFPVAQVKKHASIGKSSSAMIQVHTRASETLYTFISPKRHTGAARFEFNAQNVFNQKTAQLLYTYYNRYRTNSSEVNYTKFNFSQPYDYKALIAATSDATTKAYGALDPRFGKQDLFRAGFQGRLGIKFTF